MVIADSRARNRILLVLFVGVLMGALDIAIVGPALPAIQTAFGTGERAIAWIFSIYVLMNLVSTPITTKLSDSFGRRPIYILSVSVFAVGSLVVALSPTFAVALVGRAIQGFGAGGIFPVASAVIGDTFPPEKRGSALGLFGAVFGLAFLIGPIIGGVLLLFGWHWLFLVNLPVAAAVIVASLKVLPTTAAPAQETFDWQGMAVLSILLASLAFGLNQIDTSHVWSSLASLNVWPFLALGLALVPVFVSIERRVESPVLRMDLFKSRQVALASAFALGAGLGEASVVFVPKLLNAAFGVSESTASFMLLPIVLAMAVGAPAAGRALDRLGSRVVVLAGNGLIAAGMLLVSVSGTNLALFYVAGLLVGLGLSTLLGAPLRYIMLGEAGPSERASAQGALTLFTSTGQLAGGALVGAVAESSGGGVGGYQSAYLAVGVIAVVLTVLAVRLKGRAEELATIHDNRGTAPEGRAGQAASG